MLNFCYTVGGQTIIVFALLFFSALHVDQPASADNALYNYFTLLSAGLSASQSLGEKGDL